MRITHLIWPLSVLLVVSGSLMPATSPFIHAIGWLPVSQKVLHFCAYTWLALLPCFAVRRKRLTVLAVLATVLLGVALEFGQRLVPGRTFEVRDMFINTSGVLAGCIAGALLQARLNIAAAHDV